MEQIGHFCAIAGTMAVFGTLLFQVVVVDRAMRRLLAAAVSVTIAGAGAWLVAQSAAFGGPVLTVLTSTWFGQVLAMQTLLAVLGACVGGRAGVVLAGLGVVAAAGRGHGAAMADEWGLMVSHAVHLLASAAWLGSLPALFITLLAGDLLAARRYAGLGGVAVLALACSAAWQGWGLGGGLPGLVGTPYGAVLVLKASLFVGLLALALLNRYRLVPALPAARQVLLGSMIVEIGIGGLAVAAAVALAGMEPGMHERPLWPFALQPSTLALADPDLRREVIVGLLWCGVAGALAIAGCWRHMLWLGVPVALWLGLPHFDLLLVPAYPTSFWQAPAPATPESVAHGETLYSQHCAGCHGVGKQGDGPLAKSLVVPPADLTAEHLWDHADGELFWWLTAGMPGPDGREVMPGFGGVLSEDDRWALIDAIRATNPHRPLPASSLHHHH
ncbi:MAG: CopD family protein [Alphaproteobacteria bacterium]|nr:CopD family protein [Alphaproteobacteria bacterium]